MRGYDFFFIAIANISWTNGATARGLRLHNAHVALVSTIAVILSFLRCPVI